MFTKKQEFELLTAIKGRGEIPLKFAYLGEGAYNWVAIAQERAKKGGINLIERKLLSSRTEDFLRKYEGVGQLNVIDIGCGDGTPAYPILEKLNEKKIKFNYVPVDISEEMLNLAEKKIKKDFNVNSDKVLLDLDSGQFSDKIYGLRKESTANLLLFLGSTLGNFSDMNRVLSNILESMSSEDYLIIGMEMTNLVKAEQLIPHYTAEIVQNLLKFIPNKIGFNDSNSENVVNWNANENRIEVKLKLKKDVGVKVGSESFTLKKNELILLGRSAKFTEWTFTKLLSDAGFRTELLTTSEDRGYTLSMIQPTRYSV
ncbi:L-histidine N(alpha)-methyltransferase [Candidatus Pacearchaeota archaeon]|nr:L-histidine N(alpha)-methyltransferase [Candidatus Pacearchaeota archaeon]